TCDITFTETYTYTQPGGVASKSLSAIRSFVGWNGMPTPAGATLGASFTYDNEGRMLTEQYPGSTTIDGTGTGLITTAGPNLSYTYDSMGRLYSLTDQTSGEQTIQSAAYTAAGQLQQLVGGGYFGSFGSETRTYNSMLQLTQLSSGASGSNAVNIQYNYSATQNNGKIVSQTDLISGEQVSYTYDSLNRLATALSNSATAPWGQSFTYDGFGNLTNVNVISGSAPTLGVTYDPATNHGSYADANGNSMSGSCCGFYTYDVENRIVQTPGYGAMYYSYAPGNKRVWRGTGTPNTTGSNPQQTDELTLWGPSGQKLGSWQMSVQNVPGYPELSCAAATGTNIYFGSKLIKNAGGWVYADRLGSVGKYYPYGQERPSATQNGKEKFTGYFRDAETGLDYADQRYEAPGMGRFLTADPYRASVGAADPGSWNRYAYTRGDPINRIDRLGTCDQSADDDHSVTVCSVEDDSDVPSSTQRAVQSPLSTPFGRDRAYLIHAGGMLLARTSFSTKCEGALDALGADFDGLAIAASLVDIKDGTGDNNLLASAYGDARLGASAQAKYDSQYASYLQSHGLQHLTVADYFAAAGNVSAWTPFGGNTVYVNPSLLYISSLYLDQGLMLHEMLHEVYGLDDFDIMKSLKAYDPGSGIDPNGLSEQITTWMTTNCVIGKGNK
ncbi:MAG TPA: RHS repeat-associated core domain-containing protein, partial [Bryobacteraceae bacterium]